MNKFILIAYFLPPLFNKLRRKFSESFWLTQREKRAILWMKIKTLIATLEWKSFAYNFVLEYIS